MTEEGRAVKRAIEKLIQKFGEASVVVEERGGGIASIIVDKARITDVLVFLKNDPDCDFDMLTDLFGVDNHKDKPRFELIYFLNSLSNRSRLAVKVRLGEDESITTASNIWKSAEWFEREIYDMFGIQFAGHPDLRRILLDDDFKGHPLRKDFPLEGPDFDKPFIAQLSEEK
jgi:NADH-quinone oxidoreductase subunit C